MTVEANYNFHNILTLKTVGKNSSKTLKSIDTEYKNFRTGNVEEADITVQIGNFTPDKQDCYVLDNKYYIKDDYIYCIDSYRFGKWKLEMSGFEDSRNSLKVKLHTNTAGSMIAPGLIIDHLIGYLMNIKAYPMVHGSCIERNGQAYLFSAQGGSGKTTVALNFIRIGYKFLGDNFTILHNGHALSFMSPLNLFHFNLLPMIKDNMGNMSKWEFYLKYLFYKTTGLKIATKINIKNLFPNSTKSKSKLNTIFFLSPRKEFHVKEIGKEQLVKHIVANQKIDSLPFIKYMLEYSYIFPDSNLAVHWTRYEENLKRAIKAESTLYKVEVPTSAYETFKELVNLVDKNEKVLQYT